MAIKSICNTKKTPPTFSELHVLSFKTLNSIMSPFFGDVYDLGIVLKNVKRIYAKLMIFPKLKLFLVPKMKYKPR